MNTSTEFDLADIEPNPWNKKRPVDAAFQASIAAQGILVPLLLRPLQDSKRAYQIVAGERRYSAALKAGLISVPGTLRVMTEEEAREITLVENTHREGLTPWQRAEALRDLAALPGWDLGKAADRLGWSSVVIRRALKLLDLTPKWQKRMAQPEKGFTIWTSAYYELIALYPPAFQDAIYERIDHYDAQSMTLAELRQDLASETHELTLAPWKLDDETLVPKAGACTACPKRTGINSDLFGESDGKAKPKDRCLDVACWNTKQDASLAVKEAALRAEHGKVALVSEDYGTRAEGVLGRHEYEKVKKGDPGAIKAMVKEGVGAGKEFWIKPTAAAAARVKGSNGKSQGKTMKEKRASLENRRWSLVAANLCKTLEKDRNKNPGKLKLSAVAALAQVFGVDSRMGMGDEWKAVKALVDKGEAAVLPALWTSVAWELRSRLITAINIKKPERHCEGVADVLGLKVADLKAAADLEIPEPKSWAKEPAAPAKAAKPEKSQKKAGKAAQEPAGDREDDANDYRDRFHDDGEE